LKIVPICLLSILSVLAQLSRAQSGMPSVPEANPGRPTVSRPATLTPVGYLQFENGALFAEDSIEFSKRIGINQVTKVSVLSRLELFLQSEPLAISQSKDRTAVHEEEVFAGVQGVLIAGDAAWPSERGQNGPYKESRYLLMNDGHEVEMTVFHRKITGRQRSDDPQEVEISSTISLPAPPGVVRIFTINLKRLYEIKEPGAYTLEVSLFDKSSKAIVHSNNLTLAVGSQ